MQSLSLQGLAHRPEQAAKSDPAQALDALMQIPAVAQDVPVPQALHAVIMSQFDDKYDDRRVDRADVWFARQLRGMRRAVSESPVCFYPFAGVDTFYPMLLSNARVTIMTGANSWGRVADVGRILDASEAASRVLYGSDSNYSGTDFDTSWSGPQNKDLGLSSQTAGPIAVFRSIAAQALDGARVNDIKVCGFDLASDAGITYSKAGQGKEPSDNMAFWTTTSKGTRKLHLYIKLLLPHDEGKIGSLHALLSKISGTRQTLMLEKGVTSDLTDCPSGRALLSPPATLLKAIICDGKFDVALYGARPKSQSIHASGTWVMAARRVREKPLEGMNGVDGRFGNSDTVFIHRPIGWGQADEAGTSADTTAKGLGRMTGW